MLPSLPSALAEWAQPTAWGAITSLLAVNWMETRASEARLNQRIDELKGDTNQRIDGLRADMTQQIGALRADNRALGEKMDRILEALLAAKQI